MAKYLISFPSAAMVLDEADFQRAVIDSHAVIEEAKAAGVYVFGGGIDEGVAPVRLAPDGERIEGGFPGRVLDGGFTVLEVSTRAEAEDWARRIAVGCRCPQELREFMYDPAS